MTPLELDDEGRVFTRDEDGDQIDLGHVSDDWNCPADRLDEWADLASEWMETTAEGRAELAMLAQDYYESLGGWR